MQRWCRIFALWCFDREYNGSYKTSCRHKGDSLLYLIIFSVLLALWIPHKLTSYDTVKDSILVSYLMGTYLTILPATGFYSFIIVHIIVQTNISALAMIEEADTCLSAMGYRGALININFYIWKFCKFISIGATTTVLSGFIISILGNEQLSYLPFWWQSLTFCISYLLHIIIVSQFIVWCAVLQKRFQLLSDILKGMAFQSHFSDNYPENEIKFIVAIRNIAVTHYKLTQITKKFANAYSFSLLLQVVIYFILFLCEGYILVYILVISNQMDSQSLIDATYYTLVPGLELFVIVHVTAGLCAQVGPKSVI